MEDYLIKALGFEGQVRAYAVSSTGIAAEAQRRHYTWPTASAALGRTLTAAALLGATLKGHEKITIKIEGNGPLGAIVADGNANGEVRGYVINPQTHLELNPQGKLDVGGAVGREGTLSVVKDLGLKDFFSGQVSLVTGEIGDDFTYYLVTSEQVPSSVGLGVLVNPDNTIQASGGFMIQLLPGVSEEQISIIEENLKNMMPVSEMIQQQYTPEKILEEVLGEGSIDVLERMPVSFQCKCSKERISAMIVTLGINEITAMIEEDEGAEAQCHFCNETYQFSVDELEQLREDAKPGQ